MSVNGSQASWDKPQAERPVPRTRTVLDVPFLAAMGSDDSDGGVPTLHTPTRAELFGQHAAARKELAKRADRARVRVPKKDRAGRARVAEEFAAEEVALTAAHAEEIAALSDKQDMHVPSAADDAEAMLAGGLYGDAGGEGGGMAKESKAAKRRRQKTEADAASARRVAEEKAGMGPSERSLENAAIVATLAPLGLAIHDIVPDGHCMYAAVAHQLRVQTEAGRDAPIHDVLSLRAAAADHMVAAPDEYMLFLETVEGDQEKYVAYCERLRSEAVWGGQVELRALASVLGVLIEVHAADMPLLVMGADDDATMVDTIRLRLSFHRKYYDLGDHYNSVVKCS
jgi:OTU domain-containing protein 6